MFFNKRLEELEERIKDLEAYRQRYIMMGSDRFERIELKMLYLHDCVNGKHDFQVRYTEPRGKKKGIEEVCKRCGLIRSVKL